VSKKAEQNGDVGVVLCDCGGTLRARLDFKELQSHLEQLDAVTAVTCCSKFCRENECSKTVKSILKTQAERVVIGACDQETFDSSLRAAMEANGLNQGFLWCANIREHCGWVHPDQEAATGKAKDVLTAAVQRVRLASTIKAKTHTVNQNVLVLGAGPAALQTAVGLAQLGHKVTIMTKGEPLGGFAAEAPQMYAYVAADWSAAERLVQSQIDALIDQVKKNRNIRLETTASLKAVRGELGNFHVVVNSNGSEQKNSVGAVIIAMDSGPMIRELVELIRDRQEIPRRIAIVLDIYREHDRVVSAQVLSAAELLANRFGAEVKVFCHNTRVAAMGLENLYRRAREAGVVFVKYDLPPAISERGVKKIVKFEEPLVGKESSEEFDLVAMADTAAERNNGVLLNLFEGLRAGPEGTLQMDNVWLLPTKTSREGVFVAGSLAGAGELREALTGALATAEQVHELLKNKQIEVFDDAALVDQDKCVLCLTCLRICPYHAIGIDVDNKAASVSVVDCQRCGICAAQCPTQAIQLPRYTDEQIAAEIGNKPQITVFACENSAYPAATAAGLQGAEYRAKVRLVRVPCAGKVDPRDVLQSLERGADRVLILGCHLESCQYLLGSSRAIKRIQHINSMLENAGIDNKRVVFGQLASVEPGKFLGYVEEVEQEGRH